MTMSTFQLIYEVFCCYMCIVTVMSNVYELTHASVEIVYMNLSVVIVSVYLS